MRASSTVNSAPAKDPLHHLLELFDLASVDQPALQKMRSDVAGLEELRTIWLPREASDWPMSRKALPAVFRACLLVVDRLRPDLSIENALALSPVPTS